MKATVVPFPVSFTFPSHSPDHDNCLTCQNLNCHKYAAKANPVFSRANNPVNPVDPVQKIAHRGLVDGCLDVRPWRKCVRIVA